MKHSELFAFVGIVGFLVTFAIVAVTQTEPEQPKQHEIINMDSVQRLYVDSTDMRMKLRTYPINETEKP
jgi:hypothetical protein